MRHLLALVAIIAVVCQAGTPVHACGDKLMMLGRGIRFQSKHTPRAASVLIYLPASTARSLTDPNLESALREAGHAVRAVTTSADLDSALQSGTFDVVLANVNDAPELERTRSVSAQNAVVLPAIYLVAPGTQPAAKAQSRADRDKASKDFVVVVEVPGRPGHYCHAVDKAMELKLRREKENARRP
jgi:hypothetical protein